MHIIAVTGNAGSGKSTLASSLKTESLEHIHADEINRELLNSSHPLAIYIEKCMQSPIHNSSGKVISEKLREEVFSSPEKRKLLENILHPVIMQNIQLHVSLLSRKQVCVIEIPLLFEARLQEKFERILLITAPRKTLTKRISVRNNLDEASSLAILNTQMPDQNKFNSSDDIVLNSGQSSDLATLANHLGSTYIK